MHWTPNPNPMPNAKCQMEIANSTRSTSVPHPPSPIHVTQSNIKFTTYNEISDFGLRTEDLGLGSWGLGVLGTRESVRVPTPSDSLEHRALESRGATRGQGARMHNA